MNPNIIPYHCNRLTITALFSFFFVPLLVVSGCGGGKVATNMVEGSITLDGTPLTGATIIFSPVSQDAGMAAIGTSDSAGKFTLQTQLGAIGKGTTAGEYIVTIRKIESVPTGKTIRTGDGTTEQEFVEKSLVPELYSTTASTPLKQTIVKGHNKVELTLVSSP